MLRIRQIIHTSTERPEQPAAGALRTQQTGVLGDLPAVPRPLNHQRAHAAAARLVRTVLPLARHIGASGVPLTLDMTQLSV